MSKIVHVMLYVFAFVGLCTVVLGGWTYASNSELFSEFWDVKDDYKAVPEDRRKEVVAELPARITFEREVAEDLGALPEERRTALYEQLTKSRDSVFEGFKLRISAEAEIARKMKDAKDKSVIAKEIETTLGKVNVGIDMTGNKKKKAEPSQLGGVESAMKKVDSAMSKYDKTPGSPQTGHVNAAVNVLAGLDKLGDEVVKARKKKLSSEDSSRLNRIVGDAKRQLFNVKKFTPGLSDDSRFKKYAQGIPSKLNK
ncbi:hypothetical protein OAU50_08980 [Planctomycetota bacterium]|nr:hypothetical protein [Planctomycetota bacterium]